MLWASSRTVPGKLLARKSILGPARKEIYIP
jgi:hypothetical protein